ncbi:MAG: glycerophosphodiester phosphodiesterase [Bdellovibrio sp.]
MTLATVLQKNLRAQRWTAPFELPNWQAHRGLHAGTGLIENTLPALLEAARQGAKMAELDVRVTKDQIPVLFHDENFQRLTQRQGRLLETTLAELRQFFSVATLAEVLCHPQAPRLFNVEIKSSEVFNDPLERRIVDVVKKCGAGERILFSSFNPFSLWKMQSLLPEVPRGLLVAPDLEARALREMWLAPFLKLHSIHLEQSMFSTEDSVQQWQSQGFKTVVWTVNEQPQVEKFWRWGLDSVITDHTPIDYLCVSQ